MENIIGAANPAVRKYFAGPAFAQMPLDVRQEVQALCVSAAERIGATFLLVLAPDGQVKCQTVADDAIGFDEIGAELVVKEVYREKAELLRTVALWYFALGPGRKNQG